MPNLNVTEILDELVEAVDVNGIAEAGETGEICSICGTTLGKYEYECPYCGTLVRTAPKRKTPSTRTAYSTFESENNNGVYTVYLLDDNTLFCDCLSFLMQRGVKSHELSKAPTCKHIRQLLDAGLRHYQQPSQYEKATEWQKILLKKLGIVPHENLSKEQAYWIIYEILKKMGVDYRSFIRTAKINPKFELLPIYAYGVELEGNIRSKNELAEKMREAGIRYRITGYSHEMGNRLWKIGTDSSVRSNEGYEAVEVTSPKLFGAEGFEEIRKILGFWNEIGGEVNSSCGFHVHVDLSYNFNLDEVKRLTLVWCKIEPIVYWLVAPSRRVNNYAKFLLRNLEEIGSLLASDSIPSGIERYRALNLQAFYRHKTVEFRVHQGTINPGKVIYWVIFCLKLIEKTKQGLSWKDFSETPSVEEVLDKLGIVENAIPVIQEARQYFIGRYYYFRNSADGDCDLVFSPERIKEARNEQIKRRYDYRNFDLRVLGLPETHIERVAAQGTRGFIPYDEIERSRISENEFVVRSVSNSGTTYRVIYNPETEEISCNCRGFRSHHKCIHSTFVARFLLIQKEVEKDLDY